MQFPRCALRWTPVGLTVIFGGVVNAAQAAPMVSPADNASGMFGATLIAQIMPDSTLGAEASVVTPDVVVQGAPADLVEGGATRGANLFHSFSEFNINTGQRVYFANPTGIENILSRVTGSNLSDIDGLLGVDGTANLFLLNPNGIIFGPNARLDIRGSFLASTGESFTFADGSEFSAANPQGGALLSVSVPLGVQFGDQPQGNITNDGNLAVRAEQNLTLFGDTTLNSGSLVAPGGRIEVLGNRVGLIEQAQIDVSSDNAGGTVQVGGAYQGQGDIPNASRTYVGSEVTINADAWEVGDGGEVIVWAIKVTHFSGTVNARGGLQSGNGGFVEVSGAESLEFSGEVNTLASNGQSGRLLIDPLNITIANAAPAGFITVEAGDVPLTDFFYGAAEDAGQNSHLTPATVVSLLALNDLTLEATDTILVTNNVNANSGNDLTLRAANIEVDNARLGQSGGGNIVLETPQEIGNSVVITNGGRVDTDILPGAIVTFNGGDVRITTHDLTVQSNSIVSASTFGQGNSGQVRIEATGDTVVDGAGSFISSAVAAQNAVGDSGGINVTTNNLFVSNGAFVSGTTVGRGNTGVVKVETTGNIVVDSSFIANSVAQSGIGNGGGVMINTNDLSVLNGGFIGGVTAGQGNSGQVQIEAAGNILVNDSSISSQVSSSGVGNSGRLFIDTDKLFVINGAVIDANTFGQGNAGLVQIEAIGDVLIDGIDSGIGSQVRLNAIGDSGGIAITSEKLSVLNGAGISTNTLGQGNAGLLRIEAAGDVRLDESSFLASRIGSNAVGDSEGVDINASNLSVLNGATIDAATDGEGDAGLIQIEVMDDVFVDGNLSFIGSFVESDAVGDSEGIIINASNLSLLDGAEIIASTFGEGDSGLLQIEATGDIRLDGFLSSLESQVGFDAVGNSGGITVDTTNLTVINGGTINSLSAGQGNAGQIEINATGDIVVDGETASVTSISSTNLQGTGRSGDIDITTSNLFVRNGGSISANTFAQGDSGQVKINAVGDIVVDGFFSFIESTVFRDAIGDSNGVDITTNNLFLLDNGSVGASTDGLGDSGQVRIDAYGAIVVDDSSITSAVNRNAIGSSDGIAITTDRLSVLNSGVVTASTFAQGNSGQVEIDASSEILVDGEGSFIGSRIESNATGNSRGVIITVPNLYVFNNGEVSAATLGQGTAGPILLQSNNDLTISLVEGSSITSETFSLARGGDLTIRTAGNLTLQGAGELTVESTGFNTGAVGDLNVFARSVLLRDGVELSAQTASVQGGGDINFTVDEAIVLRRGSLINTESTSSAIGGEGNVGGNININAGFVIAVPTENSDIIANAIGGNGGNIDITANRIIGLTERQFLSTDDLRGNNSSDISASSVLGQQGTINVNNLAVDPTQGLSELPSLSPIPPIQRGCSVSSEASQVSFVFTGRGGLPPSPTDILSRDRVLTDLGPDTAAPSPPTNTASNPPISNFPAPIIEAQGAVKDTDGQITFLAQVSDSMPNSLPQQRVQCSGTLLNPL